MTQSLSSLHIHRNKEKKSKHQKSGTFSQDKNMDTIEGDELGPEIVST